MRGLNKVNAGEKGDRPCWFSEDSGFFVVAQDSFSVNTQPLVQ